MTARVIPIDRRRGRGRQPAEVEQARDAREELTALIAEGVELGAHLVQLARLAQMRLARGASPADLLDELERLGLRHQTRMTSAGVHARLDAACPDGLADLNHGEAA